ncbi:hypothetical protein EOL99_04440 [Candidatus Falkowbacteria bacterium]|nr:hypothetical protein [Candidatus Falkowbacteria bacterium]
MQFEKFNVSRPREEAQKDGTTKTFWDNVGDITIFTKEDGSQSGILNLYSFAAKTLTLNVFPRKKQEQAAKTNNDFDISQAQEYPADEIQVQNIPF